jgi:hypothetical protein
MKPYLTVNSPTELIDSLVNDRRCWNAQGLKRKAIEERNQLAQLLEVIADSAHVAFPLGIHHTSDANPDFRIDMNGRSVGVEVTCNAPPAMGEYQRNDVVNRSWSSPSPFLVPFERQKGGPKVAEVATNVLNHHQWNATIDEDRFWWEQTRQMVVRKTEIRKRDDFRDVGCNWLLLKDDLSLRDIRPRWQYLSQRLETYWQLPVRYDLIALESECFDHFAICNREGIQFFDRRQVAMS